MALIACPECQTQMSDTAPACPRCGWARAALFAAHAHAQHQAQKGAQHAEGQKLVNLSTMLMAGGVLVMFAGCGAGIGLQVPSAIFAGLGLGVTVLVAAAIVGQIGRAKQGRIV